MSTRRPSFILAVAAVLLACIAAVVRGQEFTHPMAAHGSQPNRGTFSAAPWESVDMASGNAVLTFPGLTLPGYNGMDFQFVATVNLGGNPGMAWSFGVPGPAMISTLPSVETPIITSTDGGQEYTYHAGFGSDRYLTHGYAVLTYDGGDTATLEQPNGVKYTFTKYPGSPSYLVSRKEDPFGNAIDYSRIPDGEFAGRLTGFVQRLGSTQTREITIVGDQASVLTVSWSGRTWQYAFQNYQLTTITPPAGPGWQFERPNGTTLRVTTPTGGIVTYETELKYGPLGPYPPHAPIYHTYRLVHRTVGDAIWNFEVDDPSEGLIHSTVTMPGGDSRVYSHDRTTSLYSARIYLTDVQTTGSEASEHTIYGWSTSPFQVGGPLTITPDPVHPETVFLEDPAPLRVNSVVTTRDNSQTFTTTYHYCGTGEPACSAAPPLGQPDNATDRDHPTSIHETGTAAGEWVTTYTYWESLGTPYIRGRVAAQNLSTPAGSYGQTLDYDALGFKWRQSVINSADWFTTFTKDDHGNTASSTDPDGHTTSYTYDWGTLKNTQTPDYLIERGINADGTVASETRQGHILATYEYDGLGRRTKIKPPELDRAETNIRYDTRDPFGLKTSTSRGAWSLDEWVDGFGRLTRTENAMHEITEIAYDARGRKIEQSVPYCPTCIPRVDKTSTYFSDYDALDRAHRKLTPDGKTVTYGYTGLTVTITENGHETTQTWKAVGAPTQPRLETVVEQSGPGDTNRTTTYTYDGLDALTGVSPPEGGSRTWVYDDHHRLASESHPESGLTTYGNSHGGLLTSRTDANGQLTEYDYDGSDRLWRIRPAGHSTTTIGYDAWGNRSAISNGDVETTFNYEPDGVRLKSRHDLLVNPNDPPHRRSFTTSFDDFDNRDNPVLVTYPHEDGSPSRRQVKFDYDSANRVTKVYEPGIVVYAEAIAYDPSGAISSLTHGNGIIDTMTYDAARRPSTVNAGAYLNLTYGYDDGGNVTSITETSRGGQNQAFEYDKVDRLTHASGAWGSIGYTYDALGNRLTKTHDSVQTGYTYASNRLTAVSGTGGDPELQYDNNGNLTHDKLGGYTYTPTNMLEQADLTAGAIWQYRYDADDLRALKVEGSLRETYYLRGPNEVLSEFEEQSGVLQWTVDYIYVGTRLVAAVRPSSATAILTVNKTGSGTVTSDPSGISCGTTCSFAFPINRAVTLTPAPEAGWEFTRWEGDCDSSGHVTMSAAKTCRAVFTAVTGLTVTKAGSGVGTVTSTPAGIDCGPTCTAAFEVNTVVTLAPVAGLNSRFTGWSGDADCSDGQVTMSAARSCVATFLATASLTVQKAGNGSGTVTSTPAGINCGVTCGATYDVGTPVTLAPTASPGSRFTGWSGDPDCSDGQVTMTASKVCTATFTTWTNAALAANGGTATASSTYSAGYPTSGTINGDRKGLNWGAGGGWNDATTSVFPDWLEVDFIGAQAIEEIDVFTLQDNFQNPIEPTPGLTQTVYGVRAFLAQYWTGSDWQTVPGGTVTGNNLVWRKFTFTPITTAKIRVWVTDAPTHSRLVEVEAWTASFVVPQTVTLTVTKAGSGSGTVTSTPAGIDCGGTCSAPFDLNQSVTLSAAEAPGSHFDGWSGDADCSDGQVTMSAGKTCTATFSPSSYTLSITKNGEGTVTSDPGGISCGGTCSASYASGTPVTLYAQAAPAWVFAGWSGDADCSDGQVTMSAAKTCTATFTAVPTYPLWVEALTTEGMPYYEAYLSSDPTGIECGSTCTVSFAQGTEVTLLASPTPLYWSGDAVCRGGTVTMTTSRHCVAVYDSGGYFMESLLVMLGAPPQDLTTTADGVLFDVNGTGQPRRVGWTPAGSNVGLLALDVNGNGRIDTGVELFGVPAPGQVRQPGENAFTRLAAFDRVEAGGNGDGVISAADAVYERLQVWVDRNHDGVSQSSELASLGALGITGIALDYAAAGTRDAAGNVIRSHGTAYRGRRGTFVIWDAALRVQAAEQEGAAFAPVLGPAASATVAATSTTSLSPAGQSAVSPETGTTQTPRNGQVPTSPLAAALPFVLSRRCGAGARPATGA